MFSFARHTNTTENFYSMVVETLSHKIDRTRSDIKKIANGTPDHKAASPSPTPSPESALVAEFSAIPLHPCREDFYLIRHWTPETWNALQHPKQGSVPQQHMDSVSILFWEDPSGNLIPHSRRSRVTRDLRSIWQDMHDKGKRLDCISKIGWEVREEFRSRMEQAHPWLRLCDDHWKTDQLWSNYFSGWKPATTSKEIQPETLKRERSVGEDEAESSQKRPRTLVQPTRPRPKPTTKPVAKVMPSPFIMYVRLLTHIQISPL